MQCGLFAEPSPGVFALMPAAEFLRDAHPWSLRGAYTVQPADVRAWADLGYSVRTGRSAFERVHGRSLWDFLRGDPDASATFDRSMADLSRLETLWLLDAYDWAQCETVVDVGGGNGALLVALLRAVPSLRGVLFDLPQVLARATNSVEAAGVAPRCQVEGGDFFEGVPAGFDVYVLKRIVYSYDDADAVRILRRVREAMKPGGRVLVIEPVRRKRDESGYGALLDMQMLVTGGGRSRDRAALRALFASAGLHLRRIIPTPMAALVEGFSA
ncbi:MAG: methyltransferase domain-containing protein [Candidatus Eremiobacteraeota bacterium]|nr:methyltransferase domain-containing protein [Candidatus Eremiobacteraeota bacterium]